jgi:hypothetical protein
MMRRGFEDEGDAIWKRRMKSHIMKKEKELDKNRNLK